MKILLAIDGSPFTKKMLAYLANHEQWFLGEVQCTALTVQLPLPPRARTALGKEVVASYYAEEAAKVTDPVTKFLARHGVDLKCVNKVGHPAEVIAKFADEGKFDLLIMGSHGHGTLTGLVMGSVSTQVLAQCKVPVLLIR